MSKKKLLEESTIRSFMKLANLQPLTNKFLKESEEVVAEEKHEEEEKEEEKEDEEELKEEMSEEDAEVKEEAKTLAPQKPGKMDAAKHAAPDAKMTPLKAGTHHSDKPDSIETKDHSNAPKKNNSTFEVVSENLEEMEMEADDMTGSDAAGESEEHQETVKDAIQKILGAVSQIAQEYGVEMDVQSGEEDEMEPETPPADMAPEAPPPAEDEKMMEEKLDQMVEKLTKRVAARLVKESKKKR